MGDPHTTPDPAHRTPAWPTTRREIARTESAFRCSDDQDADTPDSPCTEGTFAVSAPNDQLPGPRIEAKLT